MQRPLSSFPLPSGHLAKLSSAGFESSVDLRNVGVVELSKELSLPPSEALEIIRVVTGGKKAGENTSNSGDGWKSGGHGIAMPTGQTALELLKAEQLLVSIITFCAKVDSMLGGGVSLGKVTEFCGAPGVGKTQLCMQLAIDVGIPELFEGLEGEAIYIDTEGSFIVERVVDMATAAARHLSRVADSSEDNELLEAASQFTLERILAGIHYFRCHDYLELVALVNVLPEFITQHPKVKLVVVDSIASHFRHDFTDMGLRNRILSGLAQSLIKIAIQSSIAVVLSNQMTTRIARGANKAAQLVPALGESWGHASTVRVILFWSGSERYATLYKSPNLKEDTVPYRITEDGVRDVDPLLCSQDPSTLDITSSQFISLSSSQLEDFEQEDGEERGRGEGQGGDAEFDLRDLDQSWDSNGSTAGDVTDFISVSEMHPLDHRERAGRPDHHQRGQEAPVVGRKRPHPDVS